MNLLPYLSGEKTDAPHAALFWRFGQQRAVRAGDWKLADQGGGAKLFNLAKDIGEKEDLAAKEPEKLKELQSAWEAWNRELAEPQWKNQRNKAKNGKAKGVL